MSPDDTTLRDDLRAALRSDARLSSRPVEVEVDGDVVTLTGCVQSSRRKLAAEEICAAIAPGHVVDNRLTVDVPENLEDDEIAEAVRALLADTPGLAEQAVVVDVRAGRVVLDGSVSDEAQRQQIQDLVLRAPGAREVTNHLLVRAADHGEAIDLARDLEQRLAADPSLLGAELRLAISGDVAVLSGAVLNHAQVERAVDTIRGSWIGELRVEIRAEDDPVG